MKTIYTLFVVMALFAVSCNQSSKQNEHGHDHPAGESHSHGEGEHSHGAGEHAHEHEGDTLEIDQEEFTVEEDTIILEE